MGRHGVDSDDSEMHSANDGSSTPSMQELMAALERLKADNDSLRQEVGALRASAPQPAAANPQPATAAYTNLSASSFPPFVPPTTGNMPPLPSYSWQPPASAQPQPMNHITYQTSVRSSSTAAPPDAYAGDRDKANTFMRQLHRYFGGNPASFSTDQQKINCALSYMKSGNAGQWADLKTDEEIRGQTSFASYADFRVKFLARFGDPNEQRTAATKLAVLQQGSRTADEYIADFETFELTSGYNDVALLDKFEQGLRPALLKDVYSLKPMPVTLEEFKRAASDLDNQHQRYLARRNLLSPQSSTPTPASRPKPPRASASAPSPASVTPSWAGHAPAVRTPDVVPMDVDANRSTFKGKCFVCGRFGHKAHEQHTQEEISAQRRLEARVRAILGNLTPELSPSATPSSTAGAGDSAPAAAAGSVPAAATPPAAQDF